MDELARIEKNQTIKEKGKETRERHALMRAVVVELKLDIKCLNNKELELLFRYFAECRWLCNYLIALPYEEFISFDTHTRDIYSLDRDGNRVERHLEMPAKMIQAVYSSLKADMKALKKKKEKTGKKNGALKFRSSYNSIDLNQYRNTHWICYGDDGDKNGKYRNTVHVAGIKRPIRVFGMDQIPENAEYANAKLVKRPSGIYLLLTCFVDKKKECRKEDEKKEAKIGLDFGIKTTITTSEGEKYDISIGESERLKGLQKKLARQVRHSNGWYDTKHRIERECERIANRRKDKANKVYSKIVTGREMIVMQDENIRGWHKGLFGKQVQHSALGTLKRKLSQYEKTVIIDRFFPSTKSCPNCGKLKEDISLSDRVFTCECGYTEDRDVKAAKTLLLAGEHIKSALIRNGMSTPVEQMSDFFVSDEAEKLSAMKPEAPPSEH